SKDELVHDYESGEPITDKNLDESNLQLMMAVHEVLDGRFSGTFGTDLDVGNNRIVNMADAVDPKDAVTFKQVQAMTGDAPGWASIAKQAAIDAENSNTQVQQALEQVEEI